MNEWARLVDRYAGELKKFELVCSFCGQHLSETNVNGECSENQNAVLKGRASQSQNSIQMGSDMGQSMYFTDAEPPVELIGKRRHFFARSSKAHGAQSAAGSAVRASEVPGLPQAMGDPNDVLQTIRDLLSHTKIKAKLEASFKSVDYAQNGYVSKDDFVNILFEHGKECQFPAQLLRVVSHFAGADDDVNYVFFLQAGHLGQDVASPSVKEQVRLRISQLSEQDRFTIQKLRKIAQDLTSQGLDLSATFQKFAQKGSDQISQDEMLIAMSRVSDTIQLRDVKELHRIVVGASSSNEIEDVKVSVSEVVHLLTV